MIHRILAFFFSFFLVSFPIQVVMGQWVQKSEGIRGGSPISYTLSGTTIFAGTSYDGVYRSTDGGLTWKSTSRDLSHNAWISCLAAKNNKIYAGDYFAGIYVSADNGDSWTLLNDGLSNRQINCLLFIGNDLLAGTNSGLNVLRENNTTWTPIGTGFDPNQFIRTIGMSGNYLLASEGYAGTILRSSDNGVTWTPASNGLPSCYISTIKQSGANTYACTSVGLYVSTDDGGLWTKIDGGLPGDRIEDILIDGLNILVTSSVGPFKSVDGGGSWNLSNSGFGFNACSIFLLAGSKIFLGGFGSGIYSSSDFGATWMDSGNGFASLTVRAFETINGILLAGTTKGIYRSADNANTWQEANNGIPNLSSAYTSAFLKDGIMIYAAFNGAGVKVTDNEATSWADFSTGLTTSQVYCLTKNENTLFAGTAKGIFKYSSASSSWVFCSSDIPLSTNGSVNIINCLAVVSGKIFAGVFNDGIYSSSDNGTSWTKMNSQVNAENINDLLLKGDTLFAAGNLDVYRSTDQGINWTKTITNNNNSLNKMGMADGVLLAAGWNGVYYSLDQGVSWLPSKDGFPEIAAGYSFFSDGTTLLAGTSEGIWSIPLSDFYPSIQSINPGAGGPNEFITISGKNFNPSLSTNLVSFNGTKATVLQATNRSLTVSVPADATSGYITVIVNNRTAISPESFCVRPAGPVISVTGLGTPNAVLSSNVSGIQWYLNGFPISGATASTYTVTQVGVYTAKIVGGPCDSQLSNPIAILVTEVDAPFFSPENLVVYPNPANENIILTIDKLFNGESVDVEIVGVEGQQKKSLHVTSGTSVEISLSDYSEGLYFVRASRPGKTFTARFLKLKR
jgi:photosystem II stability/assembly factor-like uncharacterized protein